MNFRLIAVGFLVKDRFQRAIEIVAAQQQMLARMSMIEIVHYLRIMTPARSGYMRSTAMGWDFRRRGSGDSASSWAGKIHNSLRFFILRSFYMAQVFMVCTGSQSNLFLRKDLCGRINQASGLASWRLKGNVPDQFLNKYSDLV